MCRKPAILHDLMAVIEARQAARPPGSYTAELLAGGVDRIATKLREEADETVEAARAADKDGPGQVVHEAADLLYHLLVMLAQCGVSLADVEAELARRFGTSGLEEKASRS